MYLLGKYGVMFRIHLEFLGCKWVHLPENFDTTPYTRISPFLNSLMLRLAVATLHVEYPQCYRRNIWKFVQTAQWNFNSPRFFGTPFFSGTKKRSSTWECIGNLMDEKYLFSAKGPWHKNINFFLYYQICYPKVNHKLTRKYRFLMPFSYLIEKALYIIYNECTPEN